MGFHLKTVGNEGVNIFLKIFWVAIRVF